MFVQLEKHKWLIKRSREAEEEKPKVLKELIMDKASNIGSVYKKFQPHLVMILAQIGYTFLYFIVEASFNHGMNPHVYVTYRHIVAGIVMLPFAYFFERFVHPIYMN